MMIIEYMDNPLLSKFNLIMLNLLLIRFKELNKVSQMPTNQMPNNLINKN